MDDVIDLPGTEVAGGPHPHAGFETVTLVLEGNGSSFKEGSLELMTAGKGIIHTEEITEKTKARILQLWLVLPPGKRWAEPFFQEIDLNNVPKRKTGNSEIRVYSGSSQGLVSPIRNQTPVTIVDFKLEKDFVATQQIPASYTGFIYVINGTVKIGETELQKGQSGWFDKTDVPGESEISFKVGENGVRFVLYAGEPQNAPIYSYGPFIGNTHDDIVRLYHEYNRGQMNHVKNLPENKVVRFVS